MAKLVSTMVIEGKVEIVRAREECAECFGHIDENDMCDCTRAAAESAALAEIHAEIDAMYSFNEWVAAIEADMEQSEIMF